MYNNYAQTDRACGDSTIAINSRYFHCQVNLNSNLPTVDIRLSLHKNSYNLRCPYPSKL